ncbi:transcription elongation factor subunit Spt4 [Candidatus Aciduliprofundum boonei]|uniref:Transcription elongation factor Spt4 n=1 Tax=Aciduliprofundum boonei (strain DSM 19572 / T469) TaxID=439481 RepID=B5I9Y9_ACIB4|nr:transcription elongation factor subunit Spt4 [Candidatus Aciduliprofundum boonei]ADD08378.1 DNA-directed RNA polymerase subunit E, RpoE2 [Aciduliprofundum boonei T469]EDY36297.1 DNA-directed RNA polymerase subunit E'' superfamily [Aciduliprofundum boonei T469]EDY36831.1 DNA-directed RNA polymerase subunit E'' superfamily [Aciduliprofundum boonei T469]HII55706.1 DNA-directed RNA polymerase subunit E [Candidatus Aciduliprofundum boonei]
MKGELKACRNCRRITTEDICPTCGGETTTEWHGYVFILDKDKSKIAEAMGADNGEYALRVR